MRGEPPAATPEEEIPDEELVAAVNLGDVAAFETLYHRYRDWVYRHALRACGHHDDALDVLQETFAYFSRKFPGFELRARLTTFLYPVVRNLSIDASRRRRRFAPISESAPEPSVDVESPSDPADLATVLASLGEGHREVVLLRFVDDFSLEEIARALDIPVGTVKSRLHHALAQLRDDPRTRKYFQP